MPRRPDDLRPSIHRRGGGYDWRDGWSTKTATGPCAPARSESQGVRARSAWLNLPAQVIMPEVNASAFVKNPKFSRHTAVNWDKFPLSGFNCRVYPNAHA